MKVKVEAHFLKCLQVNKWMELAWGMSVTPGANHFFVKNKVRIY